MTDHADTIRPAEPWKAVERIAESDAGGWLMEFTAQALLTERQQAQEERDTAHTRAAEWKMLCEGATRAADRALAERQQAIDDGERGWRRAEWLENKLETAQAERQQAIDERDARDNIIAEQQQTVTQLRAECDRLDAKVALLDDRNHWRWPNEHALRLEAEVRCEQAERERDEWEREYSKVEQEFSACDVKLGQAIDALREIADHVPGRYVVQSPDYVQLRARARAALLSLEEQP